MNTVLRYLVIFLFSASIPSAAITSQEILSVTGGKRARIAWFVNESGLKLKGFSTETGQTTVIYSDKVNQNDRPQITSDGNRVVFARDTVIPGYNYHTKTSQREGVFVADWDGRNLRYLGIGHPVGLWKDPSTGHEWAYAILPRTYTASGANFQYPLWRYRIDNVNTREPIWGKDNNPPTNAGVADWFTINVDGSSIIIGRSDLVPNTSLSYIGYGCWHNLSRDPSMPKPFLYFNTGAHNEISFFPEGPKTTSWNLAVAPVPSTEFWYMSWSNDIRVLSLCAKNGKTGYYVGRFAPDFKSMEKWVLVDGACTVGGPVWIESACETAPTITTQPLDTKVSEGDSAVFSVGVSGCGTLSYAWLKNGTAIPNATTSALVVAATLAGNGAAYACRISNAKGSVTSAQAVLTVTADTVAPKLLSVNLVTTTSLKLTFSEPLTASGANTATNYAISPSVAINSAALQPDQKTVLLTTAPVSTSGSYSVEARGLTDLKGNTLSPNPSRGTFTVGTSGDTIAPSAPANVFQTSVLQTSIAFRWDASTDNTGVTSYRVFRNGSLVGTVSLTSYTDTALTPDSPYEYTIKAVDNAGNVSPASSPLKVRTLPPSIVVLRPAGGESLQVGGVLAIGYKVDLDDIGTAGLVVSLSVDGGKTWELLSEGGAVIPQKDTGTYTWTIPAEFSSGKSTKSASCQVRVSHYTDAVEPGYSKTFSIGTSSAVIRGQGLVRKEQLALRRGMRLSGSNQIPSVRVARVDGRQLGRGATGTGVYLVEGTKGVTRVLVVK